MKRLRRLGQYLGLIYSDDGKWRVGNVEFPNTSGMRPPPPRKDGES